MTASAETSGNLDEVFARVLAFVDYLSTQDFGIGIIERERVVTLLTRLSAIGPLPREAASIGRLLTPILARDADEQRRLQHLATESLSDKPSPPPLPPLDISRVAMREDLPEPRFREALANFRRKLMAVRWPLVLAAVVGGAALVLVYVSLVGGVSETREPTERSGSIVEISPDILKNIPFEPFSQPKPWPWNKTWRWYVVEYDWTKWTALLAPFGLLAVWLLWQIYFLLAYLLRRKEIERLNNDTLRFKSISMPELQSRSLQRRLYPFQRRHDAFVLEIDPVATAECAVRSEGQLQPVYRRRLLSAQYLLLIERRSEHDHLCAYGRALAEVMGSSALVVDIFYFAGDARILQSSQGRWTSLKRLLSDGYDDHRLIVIAEGDSLVDPVTGHPAGWTALLSQWSFRLLLTPRPSAEWGVLEHALQHHLGFVVEYATIRKLAEIAARLRPDADNLALSQVAQRRRDKSIHDLLAERRRMWTGANSPPPAMIEKLVHGLRQGLGDHTFSWLAALAAYPELCCPLTLLIGARLHVHGGAPLLSLDRLLALIRLPWLRDGTMPDWLRRRLLSELDLQARHDLRLAFAAGMRGRGPLSGAFQLKIFTEGGPRGPSRERRDHVFVDFLTGRRAWRLGALLQVSPESLRGRPARQLLRTTVLGLFGASLLGSICLALLPADRCDLLASHPYSDDKLAPGTEFNVLKSLPEAIEACAKAVQKAPENGRLQLQYARSLKAHNKGTEARSHYEKAVDLGDSAALVLVASHLIDGDGVAKDEGRALSLLQEGIRRGSHMAFYNLSHYYWNGIVVPRDREKALSLALRSVELGGRAWNAASMFLELGRNEQYRTLVEQAARRGETEALDQLGMDYSNGVRGFAQSYQTAVKYFVRASDLGEARAMSNLAGLYASGLGVPLSVEKAKKYYLRSAQLGHAEALYQLALLLERDRERLGDLDGVMLLRFAAENGHPESQSRLGAMYRDGDWGTAPDPEQARSWYRKVLENKAATDKVREQAKTALEKLESTSTDKP